MNTNILKIGLAAATAGLIALMPSNADAQAKIVKKADGTFELTWKGKPYFICGAGVSGVVDPHMIEQIPANGGNSIRTWGAAGDPELYDAAEKAGLTVAAGLWMYKPGEIDYTKDTATVEQQHKDFMTHVRKFKDHPAIMIWGIGNEMEAAGNDIALWKEIDRIAKEIKEIAPNTVTMTVLSEVTQVKVAFIKEYCPNLDILGVNSYSQLGTLPERLKSFGWDRAWLVPEFGVRGEWQSALVDLGPKRKLVIEQTSTEKAGFYKDLYQRGIQGKASCLGGYMHLWDLQPFFTASDNWFSAHLRPSCERLGMLDVLAEYWTGKPMPNRCPEILSFNFPSALSVLAPGAKYLAGVKAKDADGDKMTITWEVRTYFPAKSGWSEEVPGCIVETSDTNVIFKTPTAPELCQLFVYVKDGKGNAAIGNLPFAVVAGTAAPAQEPKITDTPGPSPMLSANHPPCPTGDAWVVTEGETLKVDAPGVLLNDSDPDGDKLVSAKFETDYNAKAGGTLDFKEDGSFTFAAKTGSGLPDGTILAFAYQAIDSRGAASPSKTGSVLIVVKKKK